MVFTAQISGQPWRDLGHVHEQGGELGSLFSFLLYHLVPEGEDAGVKQLHLDPVGG